MENFSVILVEPKYQGNIGAVARVMKNFGFRNLVLVSPPKIGSEARAYSMHGLDILRSARVIKNFKELKKKFDFLVATSAISAGDGNAMRTPVFPEDLANAIKTKSRVGIVFGREDYGLYNEEIQECDILITIPASSEYPTLNVSHSVAIVLYEIFRMRNEKSKNKKFTSITPKEKEVLLKKYDALVDKVQKQDYNRKIAKKTFRQLIGRAFISGKEAFTLIGIFRRAGERIKD